LVANNNKNSSPCKEFRLLEGYRKWVLIAIQEMWIIGWWLKKFGCQWLHFESKHVIVFGKILSSFTRNYWRQSKIRCLVVENKIDGDWKKVLIPKLLVIENGFQSPFEKSWSFDYNQNFLVINNWIWKGGI
jgi:hypothetical protein